MSSKEKRKILVLFSSSQIGGAERSLSRMAMVEKKSNIRVATISFEGEWSKWVRAQGLSPITFSNPNKPRFFELAKALIRLVFYLRKSNTNLIYVIGFKLACIVRVLRIFLPNIRIVHGIRWNPASYSQLDVTVRIIERLMIPLTDAWITNSLVARDTLIERCGIPSHMIEVIYNGIDLINSKKESISARPINVVTIANISKRKGHLEFLQVIRDVVSKFESVRFKFIGRDDMNGIVQREIERLDLAPYVECVGFVPDVSLWLKSAKLMVLPSLRDEGCPTCILEAMSYGVPVVAYQIDGISELIHSGKNGMLVRPFDTTEMSSSILQLLQNPLLLESLSRISKQSLSTRYSLRTCADEHSRIFESLFIHDG